MEQLYIIIKLITGS